jgi:hypothetical protein
MSYTQIRARVIDQTLQLTHTPKLASGNVGVVQIAFDFCSLWDGYGKIAVFYQDGGPVYHIPVVADVATVPHEVLADEGCFFFGVMGAGDNTRTTEVLQVFVAQGAITSATAETEEPAPDIYQQLLAAYGHLDQAVAVERARINELVAVSGTGNTTEVPISTDYVTGTIYTNGVSAYLRITVNQLSLSANETYYTDYFIAPELAPCASMVLASFLTDVEVFIEPGTEEHGLQARLAIRNTQSYTLSGTYSGWVVYPLASLSVPELADIRVGYDGATYGTAGEAVRGSFVKQATDITRIRAELNEKLDTPGEKTKDIFDGSYVGGTFTNSGSIFDNGTKKMTGYIDVDGLGSVYIKVTSFAPTTATERLLWWAWFDKDKNMISRQYCILRPIDADGNYLSDNGNTNLAFVNINTLYKDGMASEFELSDNVKYIVLMNFNVEDEVGLSVQSYCQSVISEEMLSPEVREKLNRTELDDGLADYVEPLAQKIALAAKEHMVEDSLCFVLYTDTHYTPNDTFIPSKIAIRLADLTNASFIAHLGDLIDMVNEGREAGVDIIQRNTALMRQCKSPYLQVIGNHDDVSYYNQVNGTMTPDDHISALYLFNATTQADRNRIVMGSKAGGYYYMDDEDSKTRTIVLNSHEYPWIVKDDGNLKYNSSASKSVVFTYSPAQLMWFANEALDFSDKDTPTEWGALVLAHLGAWGSVEVHKIMNAFKQGTKLESFTLTDEYVTEYDGQTIEMTADYSVGARSIAFLLGDIHKDQEYIGTVPVIWYLNAQTSQTHTDMPVRTIGTPTETAVSVIVVNPTEGKIYELRFGAGKDTNGNDIDPLTDYDNYRVISY